MKLEYSYSFTIELGTPVTSHAFALIAKPHGCGQTLTGYKTNLALYDKVLDGFGNEIMFGMLSEPHSSFYYESSGVVEIGLECTDGLPPPVFLQSTKLTPFCEELSRYDEKLQVSHLSDAMKADYICSFIYEHFTYERGHTHAGSDILDVIHHEKGVCQDFAHLMITIMRIEGIPSRYVSGLLDGEGESHAWLECLIDGEWIGYDPTHNTKTHDLPYIKLGIGRDYNDCTPNKGVFCGNAAYQYLIVNSKVIRLD